MEQTDHLTHGNICFALYRLPWAEECHLVLQTSGEAEQPADIRRLNGKRGFVIAPFRQDSSHPLVLIRPDVTACGWAETEEALAQIAPCEADCRKEAPAPLSDEAEERDNYTAAFGRFIAPLREGQLRKLVLSRRAVRPLPVGFSPLRTFAHACRSYPRMMVYLCHTPATGTWIGSTPEILLSGGGQEWHTVALAGTMPMLPDGTMPTDWSRKNREEQACVTDYIRHLIALHGRPTAEEGPYTARAGGLVHLKTDFHFHLDRTDRLGDLLHELHPTPAVCGLPKEEAFRFIARNEGYDRRYYSGFTGLLDPEGQTDLYVNLRCMEIGRRRAVLYAGGGILPCSVDRAEWEETGEKMKTMLHILYEEPNLNERNDHVL